MDRSRGRHAVQKRAIERERARRGRAASDTSIRVARTVAPRLVLVILALLLRLASLEGAHPSEEQGQAKVSPSLAKLTCTKHDGAHFSSRRRIFSLSADSSMLLRLRPPVPPRFDLPPAPGFLRGPRTTRLNSLRTTAGGSESMSSSISSEPFYEKKRAGLTRCSGRSAQQEALGERSREDAPSRRACCPG